MFALDLMLSKMRKEIYLYVIINIYLSFSIRKTADIVGLNSKVQKIIQKKVFLI